MKTLKQYLQEAEINKIAIGHFNISDLSAIKGIFSAAFEISKIKNIEIPIIIGVSEGEAEFIGYRRVAALIKSFREEYEFPIFINADHHKSIESIKKAIEADFDAIIFDAAKLSLKENINETKKVVEYIRSTNKNILIEGELGYIGSGSVILEEIPEGASIKKRDFVRSEDAALFVKETGVDLLAPAVGNIHGIIARTNADGTRNYAEGNPALDIERIKEIRQAAGVPLVLHGGSGISDDDFRKAIEAGISIIHINTEIRIAWKKGIEEAIKENPNQIVPYKILPQAVEEVKRVVSQRLMLFNKMV